MTPAQLLQDSFADRSEDVPALPGLRTSARSPGFFPVFFRAGTTGPIITDLQNHI